MTITAVPLSALATSLEDIDAPLTTKYLFPENDIRLHRDMEYFWGLEIYTINPRHERSMIHIRKSMEVPFPSGTGSWTLVPTEDTLLAMQTLQKRNYTVPVSERESFLTVFSAPEYEYIFVPLYTDVDFFILLPGQAPQRFSTPYTDFPRVTSSANPFFVAFESRGKIQRFHVTASKSWHRLFRSLTLHWSGSALPEDFLQSYHPESLISESGDGSEPDMPLIDPESKSGSDETIMTPIDEQELPSPAPPDKEAFVFDWVRRDANRRHERLIVPPLLPIPRCRRVKLNDLKDVPQWRTETKRGKAQSERLFRLSTGQTAPFKGSLVTP